MGGKRVEEEVFGSVGKGREGKGREGKGREGKYIHHDMPANAYFLFV